LETANKKIKVAIVILNWNGRKFLEKFLPSVVEYSAGAEVIIADNDSKDDSVSFLKEHYPQLRIILNNENGGYAKGYNDALAQVDAEYYVLLNSDIEVTPGWVQPVIDVMDADPGIAAAQPKLLSYAQKDEFEYAGAAGGFIDKYGYPFCQGRVFGNLEKDLGQYDEVREIFWATGAAMFVRAEKFWEIGGLDADFFAHMEEIDLCWRLKNAGYKVVYVPRSKIYHVGGGTLPKGTARKTYLNFRNNFALLFKNLPKDRVLKTFIARLVLDGVAAIRFLTEGHFGDTFAVFRAHMYFYSHLGELRRKRRAHTQRRVSMIYQKNLVFEHFLRRKTKFTDLDQSKFSKGEVEMKSR
jgi:GT2 family glycosyltransferase